MSVNHRIGELSTASRRDVVILGRQQCIEVAIPKVPDGTVE